MSLTFTDAEGAFATWVNTQTAGLVGDGNPMPKGLMLNRLRTAPPAPYGYLTLAGGGTGLGAENPDQRARLSVRIYGPTKESASRAAAAYADVLVTQLAGRQIPVPAGDAFLLVADDPTGPLWAPDGDEPAYLVDIDVYLRPV